MASEWTGISLAAVQPYYGSVFDGMVLRSSNGGSGYFGLPGTLHLTADRWWEIEVIVAHDPASSVTSEEIYLYSQNAANDPDTSQWYLFAEITNKPGSYSGRLRLRFGPGYQEFDNALAAGEAHVALETFGTLVQAISYRSLDDEFDGYDVFPEIVDTDLTLSTVAGGSTVATAPVIAPGTISAPTPSPLVGSDPRAWWKVQPDRDGILSIDLLLTVDPLDMSQTDTRPNAIRVTAYRGLTGSPTSTAQLELLGTDQEHEGVLRGQLLLYAYASETYWISAMTQDQSEVQQPVYHLRVSPWSATTGWNQMADQTWVTHQGFSHDLGFTANHPRLVPTAGLTTGPYSGKPHVIEPLGRQGYYSLDRAFGGPTPNTEENARECLWEHTRTHYDTGIHYWSIDNGPSWNGTDPYNPAIEGYGTCPLVPGGDYEQNYVSNGDSQTVGYSATVGQFMNGAQTTAMAAFISQQRIDLLAIKSMLDVSAGDDSWQADNPADSRDWLQWEDKDATNTVGYPWASVIKVEVAPNEPIEPNASQPPVDIRWVASDQNETFTSMVANPYTGGAGSWFLLDSQVLEAAYAQITDIQGTFFSKVPETRLPGQGTLVMKAIPTRILTGGVPNGINWELDTFSDFRRFWQGCAVRVTYRPQRYRVHTHPEIPPATLLPIPLEPLVDPEIAGDLGPSRRVFW